MIKTSPFGTCQNQQVYLYTLTNKSGASIEVLSYGGIIRQILMPDRTGKLGSICLGYETLNDYLTDTVYLGVLVGRYANRIANGKFNLLGKEYTLAINNTPNHLHGGIEGFHRKLWQVVALDNPDTPAMELTCQSADMEEGYPGEVSTRVRYTLTADNRLIIDYSATTTKTTVINLTHHAYFNLNPEAATIHNQTLKLMADQITEMNEFSIPTGKLINVGGTAFDFLAPKPIGQDLLSVDGYDHNFVVNGSNGQDLRPAAIAYDKASGRRMEMFTTEPGVQFYTSNYFDSSRKGIGGKVFERFGAFCLEAQHYADSPNQPHFPTTILEPGKTYSQRTIYAFTAE